MIENKSSLFGIIAIIIGASGLGFGIFSVVNFQVVEGPQGPPGEDGIEGIDGVDGINGTDGVDGINGTDGKDGVDGKDAPGGIVVGLLEPDQGESISGNMTIRALVAGSDNYTVSVLVNGTKIGNSVPLVWNTSTVEDGWYNITVRATDVNGNNGSDEAIVYIINYAQNSWSSVYHYDQDLDDSEWERKAWIPSDYLKYPVDALYFITFNSGIVFNYSSTFYLKIRYTINSNDPDDGAQTNTYVVCPGNMTESESHSIYVSWMVEIPYNPSGLTISIWIFKEVSCDCYLAEPTDLSATAVPI
ncbi:MAG: hypothetical protein ACFFDH_07640 [Promethearchaeota archaeon]